jgi:hypothetical protein
MILDSLSRLYKTSKESMLPDDLNTEIYAHDRMGYCRGSLLLEGFSVHMVSVVGDVI